MYKPIQSLPIHTLTNEESASATVFLFPSDCRHRPPPCDCPDGFHWSSSNIARYTTVSAPTMYKHLGLVYTERRHGCSDGASDVVVIKLLWFLSKQSESLQKWVAIPLDQIWRKRWRSKSVTDAECKWAFIMRHLVYELRGIKVRSHWSIHR